MSEYDKLLMTGWVTGQAVHAGIAVRTGRIHPQYDIVEGHLLETPEAAQPEPESPKCTVDGKPVEELAVLIKPVAFLVTLGNGTFEVGRCYFQNGVFTVGPDTRRIGGIGIASAEYFPERGLYVHLEKGYELFAPSSHCQATWRHSPGPGAL